MSYQELYEDVRAFNYIAGNLDKVDLDSISSQLDFIFSEFTETVDGFEAGDAVELIDGAADLFVTVAGLIQKLEACGVDMQKVIKRVNNNNMDKFPDGTTNTFEQVQADNPDYSVNKNFMYNVYVLKDSNDKIRKPHDFKPVDLKEEAKSFKLFEEVKNV